MGFKLPIIIGFILLAETHTARSQKNSTIQGPAEVDVYWEYNADSTEPYTISCLLNRTSLPPPPSLDPTLEFLLHGEMVKDGNLTKLNKTNEGLTLSLLKLDYKSIHMQFDYVCFAMSNVPGISNYTKVFHVFIDGPRSSEGLAIIILCSVGLGIILGTILWRLKRK